MNNTENNSFSLPVNKLQAEQFDLVILGGGTGSTIAAWSLREKVTAAWWLSASKNRIQIGD